jgi:thiamine pyrophosphokinase
MTAIIICSGSIKDCFYYEKYFKRAKFVICVDGGAKYLRKLGIVPNVLIGDLDSISNEDLAYFKDMNVEIMKYPSQKDMTDAEIAVDYAVDKGFKEIVVIGGIGTRFDHTLANIFLLKKLLDKGIKGILANEKNEITLIKDRIKIEKEEDVKVSLLPLTGIVEGITTKGLYYPLNCEDIEIGSSRGVSNEFKDEIAEVSIKSGILIVIKSKE